MSSIRQLQVKYDLLHYTAVHGTGTYYETITQKTPSCLNSHSLPNPRFFSRQTQHCGLWTVGVGLDRLCNWFHCNTFLSKQFSSVQSIDLLFRCQCRCQFSFAVPLEFTETERFSFSACFERFWNIGILEYSLDPVLYLVLITYRTVQHSVTDTVYGSLFFIDLARPRTNHERTNERYSFTIRDTLQSFVRNRDLHSRYL